MSSKSRELDMEETRAALEALLDRIDWWGALFTWVVFLAIGGEAAMHVWHRHVDRRLTDILSGPPIMTPAELKEIGEKAKAWAKTFPHQRLDVLTYPNDELGRFLGRQLVGTLNDPEVGWEAEELEAGEGAPPRYGLLVEFAAGDQDAWNAATQLVGMLPYPRLRVLGPSGSDPTHFRRSQNGEVVPLRLTIGRSAWEG
jgi:hypothetical protein